MKPRANAVRTTQPRGAAQIDRGNEFGQLVRLAVYPFTPFGLYCAATSPEIKATVNNQVFAGTSLCGLPLSDGSLGYRNNTSASTVWTNRTYPVDLSPSRRPAIVVRFQARSDAWDTNNGSSNRLYDVSTGSHIRVAASRDGPSGIKLGVYTFSTFNPTLATYSCDPRMPTTIGMVYVGSNTARLFAKGWGMQARFIATQAVTIDTNPGGADCRLDFGGSTGASFVVDYAGAFWLSSREWGGGTGELTDEAMCRFMDNPWQIFLPDARRTRRAAAAGGFFSRFYYDMAA
jgi:hypothetical protein